MTTFEKHYIGKGTQVENLDIVRISNYSGLSFFQSVTN